MEKQLFELVMAVSESVRTIADILTDLTARVSELEKNEQ